MFWFYVSTFWWLAELVFRIDLCFYCRKKEMFLAVHAKIEVARNSPCRDSVSEVVPFPAPIQLLFDSSTSLSSAFNSSVSVSSGASRVST